MKNYKFFIGFLIILTFFTVSCNRTPNHVTLETRADSVSYYLGLEFGNNIKQYNADSILNYNAFAKGLYEWFQIKDTAFFTSYAAQAYLDMFFDEYIKKQLEIKYREYIAENKAFLEKNSSKDSVVILPSGLQYIILREGTGDKPEPEDLIKVHYKGYLIDGTVFDNSYDRGSPNIFRLNIVIPGWLEAVQLMPVGSKWRIFIPSDLGFGSEAPEGSVIKPFSTLIYEIELLDINP